jgi:hypothetical protein
MRVPLQAAAATTHLEPVAEATPEQAQAAMQRLGPEPYRHSRLGASRASRALFGGGTVALTASTSACGDAACCASPAAPHSSTPAHVVGAAHLTHALALKATLPPLGSAAGALAPGTLR